MADFGFIVSGENGYTQVDGNYKNIALAAEHTASPTSWPTALIGANVIVSYGHEPRLIAAQNYDCWLVLRTTVDYDSGGEYFGFLVASPGNVSIAILDDPGNIVASGSHGLIVYNENGEAVFDSRLRYARIVDVVSVPIPALPAEGVVGVVQNQASFSHAHADNPYYVVGIVYSRSYGHAVCGGGLLPSDFVALAIMNVGSSSGAVGWLTYDGSCDTDEYLASETLWDTHISVVVLDLP